MVGVLFRMNPDTPLPWERDEEKMKKINTGRMRKRAHAALPKEPEPERDRGGNVVYERCGWRYVGGPDASVVCVQLEQEFFTQYAMPRTDFDAMTDEDFAARMEHVLIDGTDVLW